MSEIRESAGKQLPAYRWKSMCLAKCCIIITLNMLTVYGASYEVLVEKKNTGKNGSNTYNSITKYTCVLSSNTSTSCTMLGCLSLHTQGQRITQH